MPSRAGATLSHLIDPLSEDEFQQDDVMLSPDSAVENKVPAKGRVRSKAAAAASSRAQSGAAKIVKKRTTTATGRRTSGGSVQAGAARTHRRKALEDRTNINDDIMEGDETEEVDDFDESIAVIKKSRPQKARQEVAPRKTTAVKASTAQRKTASKRAVSVEPARDIPATQLEPMEIEQSEFLEDDPEDVTEIPARPVAHTTSSRARSVSRQPQPIAPSRRRAGSASSTERGGNDPALRRKLGEMTTKFEALDLKYRTLKEVAMSDAQSSFEKLRRTTEQRAKDQDELIASLKKELAAQRSSASESSPLRAQLTALQNSYDRLASENKSLSSSLTTAQNESKSLSAKLAQARASLDAASSTATSKAVPGSAAKSSRSIVLGGSAESAEEKRIWKMKEDLYSDLTGLMIRGVKKLDGEDVYDCIQTGRNGTLHFHLSIATVSPATPATSGKGGAATPAPAYEDAEFAYTPLLDEKNDRELVDILPDYLTEEICFPRSSAAKFYAKVGECMMKKVVVED